MFGSICSVLMVSDNVIGRSESMSGDLHGVQPDPIVLYSSHVHENDPCYVLLFLAKGGNIITCSSPNSLYFLCLLAASGLSSS